MTGTAEISIAPLAGDFADWGGLLALIAESFAYMDGTTDPPSSAKHLTIESLAAKARAETCFVARDGQRLVGCLFADARADHVYIGKVAIARSHQRRSIGRKLIEAAENYARALGKTVLELQTRVELTGNHAAFARLGFRETERTAHAGYDRPTSLTMRKAL